jgi:hypothetical protein
LIDAIACWIAAGGATVMNTIETVFKMAPNVVSGSGKRRGEWGTVRTNFNLVRQFAVLSFVCIALITVASTIVISRFLTDRILQRDATVSSEFVQSIVNAEGTWHLFTQKHEDEPSPELVSFSNHLAKLPDVLRANLFRADRFVLWSSDPTLIGRRYHDNDELDRALAGQISYETGIEG